MSVNSVDDILDEIKKLKKDGDDAEDEQIDISSAGKDGFFENEPVFGEDETFESVDELRERISEEKKEQREAYENGGTRVYLSTRFVFEESEIFETLKRARLYKTQGSRSILYTVIMAVAAVGFFLSCIYGNNYNWLFFSILCVVVIAAIWLVPTFHLKKLARENNNGEQIEIKITNKDIVQKTGDKEWIIPLDKTGTLEIGDSVIIIRTYHGQMFSIPKRSIKEDKYKKVLQIIKNGTEPYED